METDSKIRIKSVRQQLKNMNWNYTSPLGKAMFTWYQGLDEDKKGIIEGQIIALVDNYHQVSRFQFGPACALELLGVLLLADPNCKLVSDQWWILRCSHR